MNTLTWTLIRVLGSVIDLIDRLIYTNMVGYDIMKEVKIYELYETNSKPRYVLAMLSQYPSDNCYCSPRAVPPTT